MRERMAIYGMDCMRIQNWKSALARAFGILMPRKVKEYKKWEKRIRPPNAMQNSYFSDNFLKQEGNITWKLVTSKILKHVVMNIPTGHPKHGQHKSFSIIYTLQNALVCFKKNSSHEHTVNQPETLKHARSKRNLKTNNNRRCIIETKMELVETCMCG